MNPSSNFEKIIDGKRYSTKTGKLLCGNDYWDGQSWERGGTNTFLYRTPKGSYFKFFMTQWEGQSDSIEPVSQERAVWFFVSCPISTQRVTFKEAFPDVIIEND
jgi:hypothetical protein